MPRLALALCLASYLALFGLRTAIHWSTTGSTGFNGFHGRVGSLPWIAGTAISLSFILALIAPVAALLGWPGGSILFEARAAHLIGAGLLALGTAGALLAQLSMGDSWRVGVDETERTELVTQGLFAWVRNPIYSFMGLSLIGLFLLVPNGVASTAAALSLAGIELHVRVVEEPYLTRTHRDAYGDYAARVGRFLPGVGRIAPTGTSDSRTVV